MFLFRIFLLSPYVINCNVSSFILRIVDGIKALQDYSD
jgi:hypothetical protein